MQITIPDCCDAQSQAMAAGFASVEDFIVSLLDRDAERMAIQQGLDAVKSGRVRPFEEFDRDYRKQYGLATRE